MARNVAGTALPVRTNDLLERVSELGSLKRSLDEMRRSGRGQVVLVAGEAGVGKTAVLERFCDQASREVRIIRGACDPLFTPRPLGPLYVAVEGGLERFIGTGATPHEVVPALTRELVSRGPSVFVLEDLHWADEATLDVLLMLVRRVHAIPALVLATYRDDALDGARPLRRVLGEFATSNSVPPEDPSSLARGSGAASRASWCRSCRALPQYRWQPLLRGRGPGFGKPRHTGYGAGRGPGVRGAAQPLGKTSPRRRGGGAAAVELWLLNSMVGEGLDALDECVSSGMIVPDTAGVAFRHELARLAVEGSLGLGHKVTLHRRALAALASSPGARLNPARLAHHAEAAGDAEAVLRFALPAAERAASMGAHRECAAQYARVLRFGEKLSLERRAEYLERRAHECYLTDETEESIRTLREALALQRQLGDKRRQGDLLRWLSNVLWCPGSTRESARAARESVALLGQLPPGRELAMAYMRLADACAATGPPEETIALYKRSYDLAESLGEPEISLEARVNIGLCTISEEGLAEVDRSLAAAQQAGFAELAGEVFLWVVWATLDMQCFEVAAKYIDAGFEYCSERGFELYRLYMLAFRARLELHQGRWSAAAETAEAVLQVPRDSIAPRIMALVVLALIRARRGDPGSSTLLDEAWALAEPTGELVRLGPVAEAKAEVAWLAGKQDEVASATEQTLALAVASNSPFGRYPAGHVASARQSQLSARTRHRRCKWISARGPVGTGTGSLAGTRLPLRSRPGPDGQRRGRRSPASARGAPVAWSAPRGRRSVAPSTPARRAVIAEARGPLLVKTRMG